MCPVFIVSLSLALIVLLGGLFLLAYSKKENLGRLTKIASYVAIAFGTVVFVGGIVMATLCSSCHKSKCGKNKMECHSEMKGDCSGGSCEKAGDSCEKGEMQCKGESQCNSEMMCKGHCDKSASECSEKDQDCCKGDAVVEKVIEKEVKIVK